jgi:hypothetical protein
MMKFEAGANLDSVSCIVDTISLEVGVLLIWRQEIDREDARELGIALVCRSFCDRLECMLQNCNIVTVLEKRPRIHLKPILTQHRCPISNVSDQTDNDDNSNTILTFLPSIEKNTKIGSRLLVLVFDSSTVKLEHRDTSSESL